VVSGSFDKDVKLWDFSTGDLIKTFEGHRKEVNSVAFSSNNEFIVSGSSDKTIKIWKLR
jgi:WD40 repeat protein